MGDKKAVVLSRTCMALCLRRRPLRQEHRSFQRLRSLLIQTKL